MDSSDVAPSLRRWMSAVSDIARAVNAAQPLGTLLTRVAEQACSLIGFDYCAAMLADESGKRVTVAGSCGLTPDYIALISDEDSLLIQPSGSDLDTPAARAYREGRTIAVPDVRATSRYGRLRNLAPAQGYRSLVASPLRTADEVTGLLVGYRESPHEFDEAELELVELLAEQTAIAVHAARLRAEQQEVIGELRRGREQLEWGEQQHRKLMRLVLDDIGLGGLVDALAEILDSSITVEDGQGTVLASASTGTYEPPSVTTRHRQRTHDIPDGADRYEVIRIAGKAETWVAPVVIGGESVGQLWITGRDMAPDPGQRRMIERFALVVGVEVFKRRQRIQVEERLSGDLIADLLRPEGLAAPQAVLDRAVALGHDLTEPHWLGLLVADGDKPLPSELTDLRAAAEPARVLLGRYDDALVVVLPARFEPVPVLRRIQDYVARRAAPRGTTMVIGMAVTRPAEYAQSYRLAARAARLRRHAAAGGVLDLRNLDLTVLLLHGGTPPRELRRFAESLIMPLRSHDQRRHGDLLGTLRAWMSAGCVSAATAEALVVHLNTVGYRLARIEELTGRELRRQDTRLELQLALIIWDVMQLDATT